MIGSMPQNCLKLMKKAQVDAGKRLGVSDDMAGKLKTLERWNREPRRIGEIGRKASACSELVLAAGPNEALRSSRTFQRCQRVGKTTGIEASRRQRIQMNRKSSACSDDKR
jgi:hypothetical protein